MILARAVEDRLREEYFDLLPSVRLVLEHLEAEIRFHLLPISRHLGRYERLDFQSRVKDCQSAVESLRRRQEGAVFDPGRAPSYTLTSLRDLAGVRVLAFPRRRIAEVDRALRAAFQDWTADPVLAEGGEVLAQKYWGYRTEASAQITGEYQVVSVLTGMSWSVEHSALYKPAPELRGIARSLTMQERRQDVMKALLAFEQDFERLVRTGTLDLGNG